MLPKSLLTLVIALLFSFSKGQSHLPFDEKILIQLTLDYHRDTILPTYEKNHFVYLNPKTNKVAFGKKFKEAYLFIRNSALVFDEQSDSYNIIDRNGNFKFKEGILKRVLESHDPRQYVVRFIKVENNSKQEILYDLYNEKIEDEYVGSGYNICGDPDRPFLEKTPDGKYSLILQNKTKVVYDYIRPIDSEKFLVSKNKRYGMMDYNGEILVPLQYTDYSLPEKGFSSITPLKKGKLWYYFGSLGPLKSNYLCYKFFPIEDFEKRFGIYKNGNAYNILYKDGSTLEKQYDWISDNGIVARKQNNYYIILADGKTAFPYYAITK